MYVNLVTSLFERACYTRDMGFWEKIFKKSVKESQLLPVLRFFNTLSGQKEDFKPIKNGEVNMYNCGPTVYDFVHIGNLRSFVFVDTLRRTFEYEGFQVKQVMNITDIGHLQSDAD